MDLEVGDYVLVKTSTEFFIGLINDKSFDNLIEEYEYQIGVKKNGDRYWYYETFLTKMRNPFEV